AVYIDLASVVLFFFQAEDGIRDRNVTGVQTCALPIFKVGLTWQIMLTLVTPIVLGFMFLSEVINRIKEGYGGMPTGYVNTYGWGLSIGIIVLAIVLSLLPWPKGVVETKGLNELERSEVR